MIKLKILSLESRDSSKQISLDHETPVDVVGQWTIHGKSNEVKFPMTIVPKGKNLKVIGELPFLLSSYDITVKPVHVLFFTIGVKDELKVTFNLLMEPVVK